MAAGDRIEFSSGGSIVLTQGELTIAQGVTIDGDGDGDGFGDVTIDGDGNFRVFGLTGGTTSGVDDGIMILGGPELTIASDLTIQLTGVTTSMQGRLCRRGSKRFSGGRKDWNWRPEQVTALRAAAKRHLPTAGPMKTVNWNQPPKNPSPYIPHLRSEQRPEAQN